MPTKYSYIAIGMMARPSPGEPGHRLSDLFAGQPSPIPPPKVRLSHFRNASNATSKSIPAEPIGIHSSAGDENSRDRRSPLTSFIAFAISQCFINSEYSHILKFDNRPFSSEQWIERWAPFQVKGLFLGRATDVGQCPPTGSERTAHAGVRGRPAEPSGMEAAMADRLGVGVPEWLRRLMCQRRPRSRDLVVLGVEMVSKPVQSRLEITLPCGTGHKLVSRC